MQSRRKFIQTSTAISTAIGIGVLPRQLWASDALEKIRKEILTQLRTIQTRKKSLTVLYPKGCLGNLKPIKEAFEKETNVKIILREASLDEISSEMRLIQRSGDRKSHYDIALPPTFAIPDLVSSNTIMDLSALAQKFEPKDFRDSYLYLHGDKHLGKLYGYQTDGDSYLMFLNKNFLENENMRKEYKSQFKTDLRVPQTWEELDRQIEFFHRPKDRIYGGCLFRNKNYAIWEFWIRLHAKGVLPFDKNMRCQLNSKKSIEALKEMVHVSRFLHPNASTDGLFENFKTFSQGESYCNLGWGGTQKYLNSPESKIRDQLIFAPTPGGTFDGKTETIPYFNWGWNYVVSNQTKDKELAYLFGLYANSPCISTNAVKEASGYFDPYREEHYSDKEIIKTYGKDFLSAHRKSMSHSIPDLYIKAQGRYLGSLKQAVSLAFKNQLEPHVVLKSVSKKWDELTKELGTQAQRKSWLSLVESYPSFLKKKL